MKSENKVNRLCATITHNRSSIIRPVTNASDRYGHHVNDPEKLPVGLLLAGVFGNKSGWNSEKEDPKPTKKFMEMAINRCVEKNGGYLAE